MEYKKSACRKNILSTLKSWGGDGVDKPEALMSWIDHEIQKKEKALVKKLSK